MTKIGGMPQITKRPEIPDVHTGRLLTEQGLTRTVSCMQAEIAGRKTTLEMLTSIAMTVGCLDLPLVQRIMWECNEHWTLRLATRGETQPTLIRIGLFPDPWLPQKPPETYFPFIVIDWTTRGEALKSIPEEEHLRRLGETGIPVMYEDLGFFFSKQKAGIYKGNSAEISAISLLGENHHYSDDL